MNKYALPVVSLALMAMTASGQTRMEILHGVHETVRGVLVDAGCADRSQWNLARAPESVAGSTAPFQAAAPPDQAVQSHGITVDSKTISTERKDVVPVMNPDLRARQTDPTCSLTGGTRAYAVLLDNGRLVDLDEGGNTYAALAVQNSAAGRAMVNAKGPGVKPRVTVTGTLEGSRMYASDVTLGK